MNDVKGLVRMYILEHLFVLPGRTKSFDRHMLTAYCALRAAVVNNALPIEGMPGCLHTVLCHEADEKFKGMYLYLVCFSFACLLCFVLWF